MTDADRSRWMMFIAIAVLTLCGGGAYTAHWQTVWSTNLKYAMARPSVTVCMNPPTCIHRADR
jgi:hypothetical protein